MKIPATFLVIDGMVYHYTEYDYTVNMKRFIEDKKYLNSTWHFAQPRRINTFQLYTYSYVVKYIRNLHLETYINEVLQSYGWD